MKINYRILGLTKIQAEVRKRKRMLESELVDAVNEVAQDVYAESQRRVPVDTGNLKGSGRIEKAKKGSG